MFEQFDEKLEKLSANEMATEFVAILPSTVTDAQKKEVSSKVEQIIEKKLIRLFDSKCTKCKNGLFIHNDNYHGNYRLSVTRISKGINTIRIRNLNIPN